MLPLPHVVGTNIDKNISLAFGRGCMITDHAFGIGVEILVFIGWIIDSGRTDYTWASTPKS